VVVAHVVEPEPPAAVDAAPEPAAAAPTAPAPAPQVEDEPEPEAPVIVAPEPAAKAPEVAVEPAAAPSGQEEPAAVPAAAAVAVEEIEEPKLEEKPPVILFKPKDSGRKWRIPFVSSFLLMAAALAWLQFM
jgi:hypothetical protein